MQPVRSYRVMRHSQPRSILAQRARTDGGWGLVQVARRVSPAGSRDASVAEPPLVLHNKQRESKVSGICEGNQRASL
jgi:hypothetical protein